MYIYMSLLEACVAWIGNSYIQNQRHWFDIFAWNMSYKKHFPQYLAAMHSDQNDQKIITKPQNLLKEKQHHTEEV